MAYVSSALMKNHASSSNDYDSKLPEWAHSGREIEYTASFLSCLRKFHDINSKSQELPVLLISPALMPRVVVYFGKLSILFRNLYLLAKIKGKSRHSGKKWVVN